MVTGIIVTLSGNIFRQLKIFPAIVDPTLITASLSFILFNLAIINNNSSKFARFSRSQIFHYLEEFILVLDDKMNIVDYNRPAAAWFAHQSITLSGASMDDVKAALLKKGTQGDDNHYLLHIPHLFVLHLKIHTLYNEYHDTMGFIAVFKDVTENHFLMERLEAKAKIDSLTGIANRNAFEGTLNRMNTSDNFPLSIIMGDANGLKFVNDNYGHQYGDMMLQRTAEILEKHCPKGSFLGRLGGDEFVYLLPRTALLDAQNLIDKIQTEMATCNDLPFPLSIALGAAVKTKEQETIESVIAIADEKMYQNKKQTAQRINRVSDTA
jgi:diguanylate cyclase (GGDEF)-like protein